jgi:hypothetical protein
MSNIAYNIRMAKEKVWSKADAERVCDLLNTLGVTPGDPVE